MISRGVDFGCMSPFRLVRSEDWGSGIKEMDGGVGSILGLGGILGRGGGRVGFGCEGLGILMINTDDDGDDAM